MGPIQEFMAGKSPGLVLESLAVEEGAPYYFAGKPSTKPRKLRIALAWLIATVAIINLELTGYGSTWMYVTIAGVTAAYPFLQMLDWRGSEYIVGPTRIIMRAGAFQKDPLVVPAGAFNSVDVHQSRFQGWMNCCDLEFAYRERDPKDAEKILTIGDTLRIHDLDSKEAAYLVEAFSNIDPSKEPQQLVLEMQERRRRIEATA